MKKTYCKILHFEVTWRLSAVMGASGSGKTCWSLVWKGNPHESMMFFFSEILFDYPDTWFEDSRLLKYKNWACLKQSSWDSGRMLARGHHDKFCPKSFWTKWWSGKKWDSAISLKTGWWFETFFYVHPYFGEMIQVDLRIFLRWVGGSTTNWKRFRFQNRFGSTSTSWLVSLKAEPHGFTRQRSDAPRQWPRSVLTAIRGLEAAGSETCGEALCGGDGGDGYLLLLLLLVVVVVLLLFFFFLPHQSWGLQIVYISNILCKDFLNLL